MSFCQTADCHTATECVHTCRGTPVSLEINACTDGMRVAPPTRATRSTLLGGGRNRSAGDAPLGRSKDFDSVLCCASSSGLQMGYLLLLSTIKWTSNVRNELLNHASVTGGEQLR